MNGNESTGGPTESQGPDEERAGGNSVHEEQPRGPGPEEPTDWSWKGPLTELQWMVGDFIEGFRGLTSGSYVRHPSLELLETPEEFWILMDLPGVSRDELQLRTIGEELELEGSRGRPDVPEGTQVRRSERSYGDFRRRVRLPAEADPSTVSARLEDGVLHVRLKRRAGTEGRKIDIETT